VIPDAPQPSRVQQPFTWPVRIYYEDTDAAGIVYHANYLRFMERARTEWLRALGFEQDRLSQDLKVVFVITRSDLRYQRAARFNEELRVVTRLERLRGASIDFEQVVINAPGVVICTAHNSVACVDAQTLRPRRIPPHMMQVFDGTH
jgi:acyl-CoA thioester hydrolase